LVPNVSFRVPATVITLTMQSLRRAAEFRPEGYIEDVLSHGTRDGDRVTLSASAYSLLVAKYRAAPSSGPGAELKKLLKSVGIEAKPDCSCNKRAQLMDQNEAREPGWCEAHIEEISGWLQEEAKKRGLPYIASAGKLLIRIAIKRAKKGNGSV
jgi:hypothetical protein